MKYIVTLLYGLVCFSVVNCRSTDTSHETKTEGDKSSSYESESPDLSKSNQFDNKEEFDAYIKKLRARNASIPRSSESLTFSANDFSNIVDDSSGSYHDSDVSDEESDDYDFNPPGSREHQESQTETVREKDFFKTPEQKAKLWRQKQLSLEEFKERLKGNKPHNLFEGFDMGDILNSDSSLDTELMNKLTGHSINQKQQTHADIKNEKEEFKEDIYTGDLMKKRSKEIVYRNKNKTLKNEEVKRESQLGENNKDKYSDSGYLDNGSENYGYHNKLRQHSKRRYHRGRDAGWGFENINDKHFGWEKNRNYEREYDKQEHLGEKDKIYGWDKSERYRNDIYGGFGEGGFREYNVDRRYRGDQGYERNRVNNLKGKWNGRVNEKERHFETKLNKKYKSNRETSKEIGNTKSYNNDESTFKYFREKFKGSEGFNPLKNFGNSDDLIRSGSLFDDELDNQIPKESSYDKEYEHKSKEHKKSKSGIYDKSNIKENNEEYLKYDSKKNYDNGFYEIGNRNSKTVHEIKQDLTKKKNGMYAHSFSKGTGIREQINDTQNRTKFRKYFEVGFNEERPFRKDIFQRNRKYGLYKSKEYGSGKGKRRYGWNTDRNSENEYEKDRDIVNKERDLYKNIHKSFRQKEGLKYREHSKFMHDRNRYDNISKQKYDDYSKGNMKNKNYREHKNDIKSEGKDKGIKGRSYMGNTFRGSNKKRNFRGGNNRVRNDTKLKKIKQKSYKKSVDSKDKNEKTKNQNVNKGNKLSAKIDNSEDERTQRSSVIEVKEIKGGRIDKKKTSVSTTNTKVNKDKTQ